MNRKESNFLDEKLNELIENNIISEEQYENAKKYFGQKVKPKKSLATIFTGIGIFLVALSVITLFAINWDMIPKGIKALISFIPLIITAVMMFFSMSKNDEKLKFYTSIVAPVSILATNSLIGQIFHIQAETHELFFTSLIMFMPIAFILRNSLSIVVYCIGALTYALNLEENFQFLLNATLLTTPLIIYNLFNYIKEKETKRNLFVWITNVVIITTILFGLEIIRVDCIFIYGYLFYLINKTLFSTENILSRFLKLLFVGCVLVVSTFGMEITYEIGIDTFVIMFFIALFIYLGKFYKEPNEYFIFAIISIIQFLRIPDEYMFYYIIFINLLVLTFGIFKIIMGNKSDDLKESKDGTVLILLVILTRFMSAEIDFATKSIIFLIAGILFMAGARKMNKRIGGKDDE